MASVTEMCQKACKCETKCRNPAADVRVYPLRITSSTVTASVHTASIKERDPDTV